MTDKPNPPFVIQGSEAAAFRCTIPFDQTFSCSNCNHVLIENFDAECFICVGIKCFQCGTVSVTSDLPAGEVFAASTASLGDTGRFMLGSTVNVPPDTILTTSEAIRREIDSTAPRESANPLDLTARGVSELIETYEALTDQDFSRQTSILLRKPSDAIKVYPLVWAINHLRGCLARDLVDFDDADTCTATLYAQEFSHLVGTWRHHPRFPLIAPQFGMPGKFLHTSAMLLTAKYLYSVGNRIGMTIEETDHGPNPDLYIRGIAGKKLFFEIKTPKALRWPAALHDFDDLKKVVKRCIKKSTTQINRKHPGILVISSSLVGSEFSEHLSESIKRGIRSQGRSHTGLAAIVGVSPTEVSVSQGGPTPLNYNVCYRFHVQLNANFAGDNPVLV